jgi:hypothetical protein
MNPLSRLLFLLGGWANLLPTVTRKRVYKWVKVAASVATFLLLVLPELPSLGLTLPSSKVAALTAVLAAVAHLADRNTQTPVQVDVTPAPESGNPTPPAE